jgi:hypothetical protein
MMSAARFVFWTMPVHHSALTAFLLKVDQSVNKTWTEQHANTPPGSLRYAISNGKGGWIDLARYGPYGATIPAIAGSGLRDFKKQFYPQFGGVSAAVSGQDPFGRTLKVQPTASNPKGAATVGDELGIAVWQGIESLVPYVSTVRRLQEGGGTAYANSTVLSPKTKPGSSHMSAARRTFDPLRPTYLGAMTTPGKVSRWARARPGWIRRTSMISARRSVARAAWMTRTFRSSATLCAAVDNSRAGRVAHTPCTRLCTAFPRG